MLVPLGSLEALAGNSYSGHALGAGGCSEPPTSLVKATICPPDGLGRCLAQRDPSLRSPLLDLPPGAIVKVMGDDRSLRPHRALGEAPLSLALLSPFTGLCTSLGLGHHSLGVVPRNVVFLCCVVQ